MMTLTVRVPNHPERTFTVETNWSNDMKQVAADIGKHMKDHGHDGLGDKFALMLNAKNIFPVEKYRVLREYKDMLATSNNTVFMQVKLAGGGKRGRANGDNASTTVDKTAYIQRAFRNIRAQVLAISGDPAVADDPFFAKIIENVESFLKSVDADMRFFNTSFKALPIARLTEASQVIGMKNFDHMMRHLTKAVWHELLGMINARIEHLNTVQFTLLREVTTAGYCAAMCDNMGFGELITIAIGDHGFAAGRASAQAQVVGAQ